MSNLSWGITGLVLGLGSVFTVLFLLIFFIFLMGKIVQKSDKKANNSPAPKSIPAKQEVSSADNEDEIIAAITAAIACMAQREGKKFKISSFKRV
ncbi:MAG: OadG family protein [Clostridia bacterium]|nr:OadG family protein [Clostridia bacterium]